MAKKTAVLVVDPVNGAGLFQYLEAFFENGIPFETFAVAESTEIRTNSGVALRTDGTVADLEGRADEFGALVFACGDAMPRFAEHADKACNQRMLRVMKHLADRGAIMAGHCVAALLYDMAGIAAGRRVALHPYVKTAVRSCIGTDEKTVVDGNCYTAQNEYALPALIPALVEALK